LLQLELDGRVISTSAYPSFGFGGRNSARRLFLASTFDYKFSFSAGQTVGQFPDCSNTRTLVVIVLDNYKTLNF
jgi:hypothetical protein